MKRLNNKVAIITGAAGGIGEATAKLFAQEGAKVLATDTQKAKLENWVKKFNEENSKHNIAIDYMEHDVTSEAQWNEVVQKASELHGQINILVNDAGIFPAFLKIEETTQKIWEKVIGVNLTGAFLGARTVIPHMKKFGGGAIVNISSIAGMEGGAGIAYSSSKGGMRLLSKDLAVECGKDNIRINSIMPGAIETPMTEDLIKEKETRQAFETMAPLGRIGKAEEIAYGVLFLASDEASFVTGADLVMDGGCIAKF